MFYILETIALKVVNFLTAPKLNYFNWDTLHNLCLFPFLYSNLQNDIICAVRALYGF